MPRPKNPVSSEQLRITITAQLREELEMLVMTGRFGMTVSEAIHRLLSDGVEAAFARGKQFMENKNVVASLVQSSARTRRK